MELSSELVICAFIGFIIGTFPELWEDAGTKGRNIKSYISMAVGFAAMLTLLFLFESHAQVQVKADVLGFLLCGILWGLSFIVPGLSSSTLLLFFGLYQPMLDGISGLDFGVIIPLIIGIVVCVMLLSKAVNTAYKKYYSIFSHAIIGVVAATTVMIFPDWNIFGIGQVICIVCGVLVSYTFTRICASLKNDKEL
jgi:putative membrane protein